MKKIDPTVKKETLYILWTTVVMSALMQSVFLVIGKWDTTVLFGNLLGAFGSVFNFFLLGLTVQSVLGKDEKDAKNQMKLSQSVRFLLVIVIVVVGYLVSFFNAIATVIPFFFSRIAIAFRPLFNKEKAGE